MKRSIVLSCLFVLAAVVVSAAPTRGHYPVSKMPTRLVVEIVDSEHHAVVEVAAPPQVPAILPDEWTRGQIHNAIFFASMQRGGNPRWAQWADHVCYVDPRASVQLEATRIPTPSQPWWDEPGPTLYCTCASPVYSSNKQLLGCMATGCGGCMICTTTRP